ncbi:MAG: BMP family ABC transporter substrate-binding protein [Ruminococcaceae bacterium]|nr:BMP family ABC transporter substrate-binding protein [Oscillospiraceae bacterium]
MSIRQEASAQYQEALKRGKKTCKQRAARDLSPYPAVLDLQVNDAQLAGRVELGLCDIPADRIVGTKTEGRQNAFAADFMPLMETGTEFAEKWINLCAAHLSDEGIREPIRCYEYLGRFYVQEGNKRVSVLRSYGAPTVPAYVIRLLPERTDAPEIEAYYDFLHAWQLTGLFQVSFSRAGGFARLQAALGYEPEHVWTQEERRRFLARFSAFERAFDLLDDVTLGITAADALLVWLRIYSFDELAGISEAELNRSLSAVWADVEVAARGEPLEISTEAAEKAPGVLNRIVKSVFPSHLNVAFVSNLMPDESDWAHAHDLGRQYLEAVMGDQVATQDYCGMATESEAEDAMERAAANGADVIFATTPTLIGACRKAAAKHPDVRVLNCAASMPNAGVRTYYSRIYEGKFITGAIAGALCKSGRIGYIASSPIFGVPASVNAFALGVQLTNPEARVRLRWSCVDEDAMGALAAEGMEVVSNRDVPSPDRMREPWGLCQVWDGSYYAVASPYWHWGNVYVKLVRGILSGSWDAFSSGAPRAVSYWWGLRDRAVDVLLRGDLPGGVVQLTELLRRSIADGSLLPFDRPIRSQDGTIRSDGTHWFPPDEILHMDWLAENVDGSIPPFDDLLPMSRGLVRLQGIYRDSIPPEKEGTLL